LIKNVRVVRPRHATVEVADIAVTGERIAAIAPGLPAESAREVVDGRNRLAFPGAVDAHMHTGMYSPLSEDAISESRAAAQGGVTSSLNYMRTGHYYLNKTGPYTDFFPEVLALSEGRFHVDYAYHLAPMDPRHIEEMPTLIEKHGVTSFKIFMFYGAFGVHGPQSSPHEFLMIKRDEPYDVAHFEFVMRRVAECIERYPDHQDSISLSLHCELPEILAAYTKLVQREGRLTGLRAYSASRPPHAEGAAIALASYLAYETRCLNINLLHLSSRKAVDAALRMEHAFPNVDFRREVTLGHLLLDHDAPAGNLAKVNPPIRAREDVEFLWSALHEGKIDWVCSDHACCRHEMKVDQQFAGDVFRAKSGFGGTEYLLPGLVSEGRRRGVPLHRIAELVAWNPARRYGLARKGDLAPGYDADIAIVDPERTWTIRSADSESTQGYTPFEGIELGAAVVETYLRGRPIFRDGRVLGSPTGRYLDRYAGDRAGAASDFAAMSG
jgi:allantoinase